MNFIVGLPLTGRKFNSIWVIVDQLTKSAHFILVHTVYRASSLCTELPGQMGQVSAIGQVFLQQQLSGESQNGTL
jgi:hypothetical protein